MQNDKTNVALISSISYNIHRGEYNGNTRGNYNSYAM